jgi:pSer/pThr/pTyr-binding forkhead associated (FHA) protein
MAVRLVLRSQQGGGSGEEPSFEFDQARVAIGRGKGADVRLPDLAVSELHATLRVSGSRYALIDEGSTNGTRVNGTLLVPSRPRTLESGDELEIGPFRLVCSFGPLRSATTPERTASLARQLLRELSAEPTVRAPLALRVVRGPDTGTVVNLGAAPSRLVIGRGESAGLPLNDRDVSRDHLEIERDLDGAIARDLASKNGLVVNGKRLRERRLRHGDLLTVGSSDIQFEDPAEAALRGQEGQPDEVVTRTVPAQSVAPLAVEPTAAVAPPPVVMAAPAAASALTTSSADALVYALAGLVLVASVAGLLWLFNS